MRRRTVISLLSTAAAWPLLAGAQQSAKVWRIGFIAGGARPASLDSSLYGGFPRGMRDHGYVEGRDFVIDYRFAEGNYELFRDFAADLTRLKVDVFVLATPAAVRPVQQTSSTIPIVMGYSNDPVGNGFVASLARPGGNVTGLSGSLDDIAPKHLEILATAVLNLSRVGFLGNPDNPNYAPVLTSARASAEKAGLAIVAAEARNPQAIDAAFALFADERVKAAMVVSDALLLTQGQRIAELALRHNLPLIFSQREYVLMGGLMSYGESLFDFYRRSASFVDKIFKGARPADLPVEQPTRFHLVINLNTAKALAIDIPPVLLARADEVIE